MRLVVAGGTLIGIHAAARKAATHLAVQDDLAEYHGGLCTWQHRTVVCAATRPESFIQVVREERLVLARPRCIAQVFHRVTASVLLIGRRRASRRTHPLMRRLPSAVVGRLCGPT
jgi:hypothetical protein